jgi:hypothetical protein
MFGVKAYTRIRVQNSWRGKPPAGQGCKALPGPGPPLPSTAYRLPPESPDPVPKRPQPLAITRYRMVVEVALYDRSQPLPGVRYGCVHPNPELLFDCLQLRPHSLARRFAAHGEIALPVSPTTVGESQKIERPGFASPFPPPIVFRLPPERDQPSLVRM